MIEMTRYVDERRAQAYRDRLTDEEIQEESDRLAHAADHDNKCQKEYESTELE